MTTTPIFSGANVFLSRSLVPPDLFDALHDALKLNGAQVFLCCDPSRSSPNDFHVISSSDHEKFEDLTAKGCNLLGPNCIFSCTKEHRGLPKQGYTCCLAMDGVKVLATGFEKDEKIKIEKLVTAMGGVLLSKASLDVSFVITKNVLSAKYKWAHNVLKKPVVTLNWLHQCWNEHRLVPQEPYKVMPFTGLTICATRIPADERKQMERLIIQNGGKYSPDLTKKCTHLVSDAPEGDKYQVARRWGHINIVTPKWVDQSVARRACLDEEHFPVRLSSVSSSNGVKGGFKRHPCQNMANTTSQSFSTAEVAGHEPMFSQSTCSASSDATVFAKEGSEAPNLQVKDETANAIGCVAEDSGKEDNDLYLSDCRVFLVGFEATEMRKLVNILRKGGATRHMSLSEKLTHIVAGSPSESEWKEVRRLAAWGVIKVVRTVWLDDCAREKKEVPVSEKHIFSNVPRDAVNAAAINGATMQMNCFGTFSSTLCGQTSVDTNIEPGQSSKKNGGDDRHDTNLKSSTSIEPATNFHQTRQFYADDGKGKHKWQQVSNTTDDQYGSSLVVFKGRLFRFSSSFPEERRAEVVEWVVQGGGLLVDDCQGIQKAHFIIEPHGLVSGPRDLSQISTVSSHWIRFCLEEGRMLDVGSHILYSPLPCHIPLPGFEVFRICISQYEEKDRLLLRNLCFVLGSKFTEKLSKKVTHLLCKFTSGPKYEAACKWGIESVTSEWIIHCVRQDTVVDLDLFRPKPATDHDREAGLCTMSQYPTQAVRMISGDVTSQLSNKSQGPIKLTMQTNGTHSNSLSDSLKHLSPSKKARHVPKDEHQNTYASEVLVSDDKMDSMQNSLLEDFTNTSHSVPDVASAIEDLLEQSSKIQDMKSPVCDRSIFLPDRSLLGQDRADSHPSFGVSQHWLNRTKKEDVSANPSKQEGHQCPYDGFSETQTDSQVVGYEEDLSGRQMIIDRVRTRSMT